MTTATERVGRYQLLDPIGVGPSGSVSRAKVFGVAGFERQFAVKRFHSELTATAALAQSLSAAARGYGSLEHPRIARMSEYGVAQGTTFTAVEFVAGLDALRLIAEARLAGVSLATGGALALVSQAARAVGYAHGRGLTHLGLAPTNVIVTAEGDVKITDFGILSASLPQRPIDAVRLAHRIQYLAPEQLANEATSAATDVFALGVLAYELVTGQRTFRGDTPQQIAQSVMAGPPAEPPLPRPIVRVLQRCLARSPFERFPDARALADALDAALRVAPVPGTRKDVGAQVKQTLDRLAALRENEQSGVVAFNVGTGPVPKQAPPSVATLGRESQDVIETSTLEFVRPDVPVPGPAPLVGPARTGQSPATTMPDLPKVPMTTVTGLAPPPIPVPPGMAPSVTPRPPTAGSPNTLLGIATTKAPPSIPPIRPPVPSIPRVSEAGPGAAPVPSLRPITSSGPPPFPRSPEPARPATGDVAARLGSEGPTRPGTDLAIPVEPSAAIPELEPSAPIAALPDRADSTSVDGERLETAADRPSTVADEPATHTDPGVGVSRPATSGDLARGMLTDEMSPILVEKLNEAAVRGTSEMAPLVEEAWRHQAYNEFPDEAHVSQAAPPITNEPVAEPPRRPTPPSTLAGVSPPPRSDRMPVAASPPALAAHRPSAPGHPFDARPNAPSGSRLPWIIGSALGVVALGLGGWFAYGALIADGGSKVTGSTDPQGSSAVARPTATPDAAKLAAPPGDSGATAAAGDASVAGTPADAIAVATTPADARPAETQDALAITSTPAGARVFLDGADAGVTPLKLPGSPDRHTIALLLAGHELYVAAVDGHGSFAIPLKEVTPTAGRAGIKVIKCKDKERYYVFVDGKPTGQTCPTERIEADLGPHTVEVYDVVSETRKKWEINIKDTRLSYRVRIE